MPTKLTCDSGFPLGGETVRVKVRVQGRRILVERASRKDLERFGELPIRRRRRRKGR